MNVTSDDRCSCMSTRQRYECWPELAAAAAAAELSPPAGLAWSFLQRWIGTSLLCAQDCLHMRLVSHQVTDGLSHQVYKLSVTHCAGACQYMRGKLSGCKSEEQQAIVLMSTCLKQQQRQQQQLIHSSHLQQVSNFRIWYELLID